MLTRINLMFILCGVCHILYIIITVVINSASLLIVSYILAYVSMLNFYVLNC